MELGHHGIVKDFSYGRIVYFYALPGTLDDYQKISMPDIADIAYLPWKPVAYLGSAGYRFIQAEELVKESSSVKLEKGKLWAEDNIMMWKPSGAVDKLVFKIHTGKAAEKANIGFTLSHGPEGGTISFMINGNPVKFDGNEAVKLFEPFQTILANHFSESIALKKGINEVIIESRHADPGKKIGIDFIWMKEH